MKERLKKWLYCNSYSLYFYGKKQRFELSKSKLKTGSKKQHFTILILSYNNEKWCEKNILSAKTQDYPHFDILYIDDASTDNTASIAQSLGVKTIKNSVRKGAAYNAWSAIHSLVDETIVVILDGDDWLAHDHVLSILSYYYDQGSLVTYGQHLEYPSYKMGSAFKGKGRSGPFYASHLRTFKASLFKKIKLEDILYEGEFTPVTSDLFFMFPLLEMAGKRARYIEDILYIYNMDNPLNVFKTDKKRESEAADYCRNLPRYKNREAPKNLETDIVIFSYKRPLQLYALLETLKKNIKNYQSITLLYRVDNEIEAKTYDEALSHFPHVKPVLQEDFRQDLLSIMEKSSASYLLFAVDDNLVKEPVDLKFCAAKLKQSHAHGFFFRLGKNILGTYMLNLTHPLPNLISIDESISAFEFDKAPKGDWSYPNNVDMTLYEKEPLLKIFKTLKFHNPNTLEAAWAPLLPSAKIGLCFNQSKIVNIPLNLVNPSTNRALHSYEALELLDKFKEGWKMDIEEISTLLHTTAHIDYNPKFIHRSCQ